MTHRRRFVFLRRKALLIELELPNSDESQRFMVVSSCCTVNAESHARWKPQVDTRRKERGRDYSSRILILVTMDKAEAED